MYILYILHIGSYPDISSLYKLSSKNEKLSEKSSK